MKKIKKFLSFALAFMLAMTMSTAAYAADLTIHSKTDGHTFEAYQVFAGTNSSKGLVDIEWGAGVNGPALLEEFKTFESADGTTPFQKCVTAYDVAKVLENIADKSADADAVAELIEKHLSVKTGETKAVEGTEYEYKFEDLADGYYFVKDAGLDAGIHAAYTKFILWVTGDGATVEAKTDIPSLDKEIMHNESGEWEKAGDNQIGDAAEFRITTTVPYAAEDYELYDYVIYDTMSEGLTSGIYGDADVVMKVNDDTVLDDDYYDVEKEGENGFKITVKIKEALADGVIKEGDTLVSYYTGTLNWKAAAAQPETNKAHLEYSNNPYDEGSKGRTPEVTVYDWTFDMSAKKIDGDTGEQLDNAKFVLSRAASLSPELNEEGTAPKDTADLIAFVKVSDENYRVATPEEIESGNVTYIIEIGTAAITGLDDSADYYLHEVKAPEGYNKLEEPVKLKLTAEYDTPDRLKEGFPKVSVDGAELSSVLRADIVNHSGAKLPSTGGIGTAIFYAAGGILVAAAVLLAGRKRTKAE